ncbi:polyhydroxyalkanoic acid inclusion protein PhaP [Ectobacillus panaciterrae]|uniref:polyhydroxyalkanoic acid inclusion protein PhaP n=1 Tax=Ectobacillus panaciterrae TaxID=363872 RepID=UPI0003FD2AD2|nr:polyhydroxyalkanoic acid inclusion protein PhaP [Ectobacillus panaciterrae]
MEAKTYEIVEAFWNNWSHSLSLLTSVGKQMEDFTIETVKQQQEAFYKMTEGLEAMEQEMKQYTSQMSTQYTDYMKQFAGTQFASQIDEWQEKWNELSQQMEHISSSPAKSSLSLLSQTSGQFEDVMKQWLSQQQQQREDVQKQMEDFLQGLRATQLDLVKKFEESAKQVVLSVR